MASTNSHLEKVEGNMSSVTNSYGHKMTTQNQIGTTSSDESSDSYFSPKDNRKASAPEDKPSFAKRKTKATKNKDKKKRKTPAVSNECSFGASSFATTSTSELHKKQKLQDDDTAEEDFEHGLTTPEGQMALNPSMTEDEAKAEAKREYNRRNAARARKRNKHMVGGLQEKIHGLTKRAEDLQRSNDVLCAQLEVLQTQNRVLLVNRKDSEAPKQQSSSSNNDILSQLLEQLQGNSEAQQQQPKQQGQDMNLLFNSLNGHGSSSQHHSTLQGGPHGGNILSGMQGQGNSHLMSALLNQNQAQQQIPHQQQQSSSNQTGLQGQSMSQLLGTFGFQGQQQQQQQQRSQQQSQQQQPQQYQQQSQQSQQGSGATQDRQQHLQQLLSSMPPEALYNMLRKSSA
jgi:hypothetical protein